MSNKYHIEIFYLTENLIFIAECVKNESKEVGKYTENEWNWMKLQFKANIMKRKMMNVIF